MRKEISCRVLRNLLRPNSATALIPVSSNGKYKLERLRRSPNNVGCKIRFLSLRLIIEQKTARNVRDGDLTRFIICSQLSEYRRINLRGGEGIGRRVNTMHAVGL